VDRPHHVVVIVVATSNQDLLGNLRQQVALLLDQRGDGPTQRRAPARSHLRESPSSAPSKNSSPVALIRPPVSTTKGTKLLWPLDFAVLMNDGAAARLGVWSVPIESGRRVPGHTTHVHQPGGAVLVHRAATLGSVTDYR
jgi:hypothetical protein